MKRFTTIAAFMLLAAITSGQLIYRASLSKQEASDLLKSLDKKMDDSTRLDILLKLSQYNLEKLNSEKPDHDSAAAFIKNAKEINSKLLYKKEDIVIAIYESTLTRKSGDTVTARRMISNVIKRLQNGNDELNLEQAYLELSRCYDSKIPEQAAEITNVFNALIQRVPKLVSEDDKFNYIVELITFYARKMKGESYPAKLDFLDHFVQACRIVKDRVNEFWARKEVADIHYKEGKLEQAKGELLQIVTEQKEGNYPRICFTYDLLSAMYIAIAKYDSALYYSLETIKSVKIGDDSLYLSNFYARVASNYSATGSIKDAVEWNLKRLNYLIARNQTNAIYVIIYNVVSDLLRLEKPDEALDLVLSNTKKFIPFDNWEKRSVLLSLAKCYSALNKNELAEKYCEEVTKFNELRLKLNEITSDLPVDEFAALFYLKVNQYDKAQKHFQKVMDVLPKVNPIKAVLYESDFLFKLDSAKGNYVSAIKHLRDYQKANDSIFTEAKSRQIEELKVAYETDQKAQNIKILEKQDQLQKSKIKQEAMLRNISFALALLLIIIMALLYNRYRLKQKTNKKLESQQNEISKQNISLQHLVNEKEWLLKEIHHRVKNNLQVVMSLLNSQSAFIDNDAALTAIHDSQHRVHAMSLIHQKLYNSENVSSIDMSSYIRELVSYLSDSFDTRRIHFELNIEPIKMDVSQAVPLGLILNEAITNSLKYAFPDSTNGIISISLLNTGIDHYVLTISDNGIGIPANVKKIGSLGMSLMKGLSEDLDGDFSIENNNGTTINISFKYDPGIKRSNIVNESFVLNN